MFEQWGFLLAEIWVLLVLSALIGVIAGWLMFGGGQGAKSGLQPELDQARSAATQQQARISGLEKELAAFKGSAAVEPSADVDPANSGKQPVMLDGPKDGQADNLKKIKGVGSRLEQMCNMMGIWHYDQIANWSDDEIIWVDANLQGFPGRVTRDDWVVQAKVLASGGETEFSKTIEDKTDD